jgi:hypothetical protein
MVGTDREGDTAGSPHPRKTKQQKMKQPSRKARSKADFVLRGDFARALADEHISAKLSDRGSGLSRNHSRVNSDNEDLSDDITTISNLSLGSNESPDKPNTSLSELIRGIEERKLTSVQGREKVLAGYTHLLRHHYSGGEVARSFDSIWAGLLKSIKGGDSGKEQAEALTALTMTIMTVPPASGFDDLADTLKKALKDGESDQIKVRAMQALVVAAIFGGGDAPDWEKLSLFLLGIVETDGQSVGAADSGPVVVAALESWAFVVSSLAQIVDQSQQALEAFIEQLDSSDPEVQAAAGTNIAFLYEMARTYDDEDDDSDEAEGNDKQQYNLRCNFPQLIAQMTSIARQTSKSISKKNKRNLRQRFRSIVTSLESGKGPGYSQDARPEINPNTGGNRVEHTADDGSLDYKGTWRIDDIVFVIDSWSTQVRLEFMRDLLGGGFSEQYKHNRHVKDVFEGAMERDVSRRTSPGQSPMPPSNRQLHLGNDDSDDEAAAAPSPLSGKAARKQKKEQRSKKIGKAGRDSLG